MNADKSSDLLTEMTEDLQHMPFIAARLQWSIRDAITDWNALSDSRLFPNDLTVADDFADQLDSAATRSQEIREDLADLDWLLANVIHLRGKLAEELGVPMMSHITGGAFARNAEFTM